MIASYADCTGIEAGYSYFAPSIPGHSKLFFELHYSDGRVEYDLPVVGGAAAGYRVATLLDNLHAVHYARIRHAIIKTLVLSIHEEHRDAVMVRAVFGVASLTSASEFRMGKRISYEALYVYDFRFGPKTLSAQCALARMAMSRQRLREFLFPPDSGRWVGILRIGLGLQVTFYAGSLRADWNDFFGTTGHGLVNRALTEAISLQ